jgi:hypothetical protein
MDPKAGPGKRLYTSATRIVRATASSLIVEFTRCCSPVAQIVVQADTSGKFVTKMGPNNENRGPINGAKHLKMRSFSSGPLGRVLSYVGYHEGIYLGRFN